jgi:hypothetical protein
MSFFIKLIANWYSNLDRKSFFLLVVISIIIILVLAFPLVSALLPFTYLAL